jgi:ribonuclease PH
VADVDMNVVMNAEGEFIELQGTAEGESFARSELSRMLDLAQRGIHQLLELQQERLT